VPKNRHQIWCSWVSTGQAWFIALGRIFDRSSGASTINHFLAATVAQKGLFSKCALADRKRKAVRGEPSWLDEYLKTAWEPNTADLEGIVAAIKPAETKYAERYKAIRDKLFAHRDPSKLAATLFDNTLVSDIEDILFTLNEIMLAIFQLLENGSRYPIGTSNWHYADTVVTDTRSALEHI
jgi:AbiU2